MAPGWLMPEARCRSLSVSLFFGGVGLAALAGLLPPPQGRQLDHRPNFPVPNVATEEPAGDRLLVGDETMRGLGSPARLSRRTTELRFVVTRDMVDDAVTLVKTASAPPSGRKVI